ncbi:MAG: NAD(P)H-dependent glycerol-3-phosphate dehydrogenase [Clostridia bacterium]|nr:NAD(P)H-dependent glycerol-3-phosphate dehydrogenase [Clostridia bacterium]
MSNICVLGSGGWGTAIAMLLLKNNHNVTLWSFTQEECDEISKNRENTRCLPGVKIPSEITLTADINSCKSQDVIVIATPSHGVRSTAKRISHIVPEGQIILNISKGIEEVTYLTMSQVLREELPHCRIAVMSGPSHAEEVSRNIPTTNVVASDSSEITDFIQDTFMTPDFRIYTSDDIIGVELGGSVKNVIALCCGILDGLGCGDNTKAALMTRGLVEMTRLGTAMGAKPETFSGLSGVGDLIVTCTSMHSRNRRAGILIGQGKSVDEAQKEVNMVVEGVRSCRAAKELADKVNVEMPIVSEAYDVLFNGKSPKDAISNLMKRSKKHETEHCFLNTIN